MANDETDLLAGPDRLRAFGRRRLLWLDWQRDRRRSSRMVLVGETPKGHRSLSVAATSPAPGSYEVEIPTWVATAIEDEPGRWHAQFGRRRVPIAGCQVGSTEATTAACTLTVDFAATRRDRRSPDGVYPATARVRRPERDVETTRALYAEVGSAWRQLTEVRFRLLALLPLVSGLGFLQLLSPSSSLSSAPRWARALFAAFGAIVTAALYLYERRNSDLYDDLISRGKHLEHELGVQSGVFLGRLGGRWPVRHDVALRAIYGGALAGWIIILVAVAAGAVGPDG